jgi:hypothetical protein
MVEHLMAVDILRLGPAVVVVQAVEAAQEAQMVWVAQVGQALPAT